MYFVLANNHFMPQLSHQPGQQPKNSLAISKAGVKTALEQRFLHPFEKLKAFLMVETKNGTRN